MTGASDRGTAAAEDGDLGPDDDGRSLPVWQELGLLVVLAVVLAVVVKAFFVQAFYIPSASMQETLRVDDRILVEKPSLWWGTPRRGDVVVFADPGGWLAPAESTPSTNLVTRGLEAVGLRPTGGHLVKRVIGVGGDRVTCCDSAGRVSVNGVALRERSYLAPGAAPSADDFDVRVAPGYLWVMGDNRGDSADSRAHLGDPGGGQVPVDDVVGRAVAVVWPLRHGTVLHRPATFAAVP